MAILDDSIGYAAADNGTFLGKTEPSRQTKFSWWEVFYHNGKIIACVYAGMNGDFCCCEEVKESELGSYVDDVDVARQTLEKVRGKL